MNIIPINVTPVAVFQNPELVSGASGWFETHRDFFEPAHPCEDSMITTLKGYKASDEVNLPEGEFLEQFKEAIIKNTVEFLKTCGYAVQDTDLRVSRIWLNEMFSGSYHELHMHYGKAISGCFYVAVPENSGPIKFITHLNSLFKQAMDVDRYTNYNSETWTIEAQPGNMFIWESYIPHEVPSREFEGVRRSIAFDVVFR